MIPFTERPPSECPLCGHSTWWRPRRPTSIWICGICVPPLLEPHEVEWREGVLPEALP